MTPSRRLPRGRRLRRAADLRRVLADGRRCRTEHLEMIWNPNREGYPRLGLLVPKYTASAVARNRLRRRLRELWRTDVQHRQGAQDLVIRARSRAYGASFEALRADLDRWRAVLPDGGEA